MENIRCRSDFKLGIFILIIFLAVNTIFGSMYLFREGAAESREFDVVKFDENITLSYGGVKAIDFNLEKGEEFEIVYTVQVKEGLPIDLWLVNEDNYLLLISDVNFLYFIDGSDKEVSYTRKIVSLKEEGLYKLVMANIYNNQTVTANIIYEIRSFQSDSEEESSGDLSNLLYPLIIAVIVLAVLSAILFVNGRKLKREKQEASKKVTSKKKSKKRKYKKPKPKVEKETVSEEKPKELVPKEEEPEVTEKVISGFCGNCGEAASTPFCKKCGRKI